MYQYGIYEHEKGKEVKAKSEVPQKTKKFMCNEEHKKAGRVIIWIILVIITAVIVDAFLFAALYRCDIVRAFVGGLFEQ